MNEQSTTNEPHPSYLRLAEAAMRRGHFKSLGERGALTMLARLLNEGTSTVINWRRRGVSADVAIRAEGLFGISANYICTGEGPMFLVETDPRRDVFEGAALAKSKRVPVYGAAVANPFPESRERTDGDFPTGDSDRFGYVTTSDPNAFLTRVEDTSMWPRYAHNEYALVEPNTVPEIEDDVLVKLRGQQAYIKRLLSRRGGVLRLGSYNNTDILNFDEADIEYCYYIAHPVPSKNIHKRLD